MTLRYRSHKERGAMRQPGRQHEVFEGASSANPRTPMEYVHASEEGSVYEWQEFEQADALNLVNQRDPRSFPIGYSSVDDGAGACVWFADAQELVAFILEVETQAYSTSDDELVRTRSVLASQLEELAHVGLDERSRLAINEAFDGEVEILWWGRFEELCEGASGWPAHAIEHFRADDEPGGAIGADEVEAFIEYLATWGA